MRNPAVAGAFYPAEKSECERMLSAFKKSAGKPAVKSRSIVAPHAGWVYSGATAMRSFLALENADTFVILSPNHTGRGSAVSTSAEDWETPLGVCKVDSDLVGELVKAKVAKVDESAHAEEHSIEVQLPFLQFLHGGVNFVPITFLDQSLPAALRVAEALAKITADISIIASSDFTHYEPAAQAKEKDMAVIGALLKMDAEDFYARLREERATACGYAPIACALHWAKLKGAKRGRLLGFTNSGDASGDYSAVVDYASIAFV